MRRETAGIQSLEMNSKNNCSSTKAFLLMSYTLGCAVVTTGCFAVGMGTIYPFTNIAKTIDFQRGFISAALSALPLFMLGIKYSDNGFLSKLMSRTLLPNHPRYQGIKDILKLASIAVLLQLIGFSLVSFDQWIVNPLLNVQRLSVMTLGAIEITLFFSLCYGIYRALGKLHEPARNTYAFELSQVISDLQRTRENSVVSDTSTQAATVSSTQLGIFPIPLPESDRSSNPQNPVTTVTSELTTANAFPFN